MFDIMKAVRETAAARSAVTRARRPRPELIRLRVEIERTKCAIEAARNHFEQAVDPTLIDCYIYELTRHSCATSSCCVNLKARRISTHSTIPLRAL